MVDVACASVSGRESDFLSSCKLEVGGWGKGVVGRMEGADSLLSFLSFVMVGGWSGVDVADADAIKVDGVEWSPND